MSLNLEDPSTQEEIEAVLRLRIEADSAETGLYQTGFAYVVVDRIDGKITFQWFHDMQDFNDLMN
jgi:hypothetical protein